MIFLLLTFLVTSAVSAQEIEEIPGTITVATFNIRQFSDRSRDDDELKEICSILRMFDFVAIQEVKDEDILIRTVRMLSHQYGDGYDYLVSDRVGRGGHYERYGFLFRRDLIELTDSGGFIPDPVDYFIREPYFARFKAANFDFYVISFHLLYGKRKSDRRQEAMLLDDVFDYVQELDDEDDIILVGDFNLEPDDEYLSELRGIEGMHYINLEPTTLGENLYDNIWFQSQHTTEYMETGIVRFDEDFFDNDDDAAKLVVSDHRPLWARFDLTMDDDD